MKIKIIAAIIVLPVALLLLAGCVDHRDIRNGVPNENVYLPKDFLTRENPHKKDEGDHAWLYKVTVVKGSVPDPGLVTLGDSSVPRYVDFSLTHDKLEMIDNTEYAPLVTDAKGQKAISPSLSRTVLNAWPGSHVDIRLRDNLDGERTNFIEENLERDWKERQWFKIDFEKASIADVNMLAWYLTDYSIGECMKLKSVSLVPDSFELEELDNGNSDDYFSWTVAVTYELGVTSTGASCGDQMTSIMNRSTFTYHLKYSFWRTPKSSYSPVELAEKDPVRLKVGAWETGIWNQLAVFHDPKTNLPGAKSMIVRFDPNKKHTFYFSESWPEKYKDHFRNDVAKQFNDMMAELGKDMRIDFQDWNVKDINGKEKERKYGDIRYSVITYHNAPSTTGLIGMAYMNSDPRTGETLSGGFNMYDWVDQLYASYLQDYIKEIAEKEKVGDFVADTIEGTCKAGEVMFIDQDRIASNHAKTSLYSKLESFMNQESKDWVVPHSEDFHKYVRMLLPDLSFAVPWWNTYVWNTVDDWRTKLPQMQQTERTFQEQSASIDRGESPWGALDVLSPGAKEKGLAFINETKNQVRNHFKLKAYKELLQGLRNQEAVDGWELGPAMMRSSRQCKTDGTWETRTEWTERVVDQWYKVFATHEFGHTLGLRHNFAGSMDKPHFEKHPGRTLEIHYKDKDGKDQLLKKQDETDITSSIMEYAFTLAEAADLPQFKPYDRMALKFIYGGVKPDDKENWLYCTDEHSYFSPLCQRHDIGTTPTEIVKNEIDYYEWRYKFRNYRTFRKFWDTSSYESQIISSLYPLRRFLNLWAIDWQPSEIKNDLMLLGVKGDQNFFDNINNEFIEEMGQANRLVANFYKAILQQSAAERSYQTRYDNFYGDVTQQGIILDKLYATFLFLGLWAVDDYDQNVYSALAYHEVPYGNALFFSDVQDIANYMLGGQYDAYPWFKPSAVLLFAQDTHDVMFGDKGKQKWIQMLRFDRVSDLVEYFDRDPRTEALAEGNAHQTFLDKKGSTWIYYYLKDRNKHVVASKDENPISFKLLWDQNEDINIKKYGDADDYEIKYYLDFYEYFN